MALKLDILANTRQFTAEMKRAGAGVEDISDALDDMAEEAQDAGNGMERTFRDIARSADDTGRKVGKDLDKGFDRAKKGADDFKREANSTARESAASFTGSAEDIGDAFQEVAANALEGFGPAGAAAGLAIAGAVGIATTKLQEMAEQTEENKRRFSEMYQQAAEDGRTFLDQAQIIAASQDLLFNPDRADEYKQSLKDANTLGIEANDIILARSGDEEALQRVMKATEDQRKEVDADFIRSRSAEAAELIQVEERYRGIGRIHDENSQKAKRSADLVTESAKRTRDEAVKTGEALKRWAAGDYTARLNVDVNDRTPGQMRRIVNRINGQVASIQISAGIGGKQIL